MLKISEANASSLPAVLILEGRLGGPWVDELRRACETILGEGKHLTLNLENMSFADSDGITALLELRRRGVVLESYSPFVEEQLKTAAGSS